MALTGIAASLFLAGCGGGSGSSSTTPPVVNTCANGAVDYPTCTPAITPANLQLTVPAPPFAQGSQDLVAFTYLNDIRSSLGLGKLAYSAELTKSASNHANYLQVNGLNISSFHIEDAALPGFTGIYPSDRALFAGYTTLGGVNEVIAVSNTKAGATQRLIDTIYHRAALFAQEYTEVGSASYCNQIVGSACFVFEVGFKKAQSNASDFVMVYPKDGQTNITLSMGGENPNPFPEISVADAGSKIGYPVTFAVEKNQTLTVTTFTIAEAGQQLALDTWLLTASNDTKISKNEAYLTKKGAMKPSTTYNVSFVGTANSKNVSKKWSFTTAAEQVHSF